MADVFISYAREDLERVRPLVNAIEAAGYSVFWDRTIPAGMTWRKYIGKALDERKCVIVVWSKSSVGSDWVKEEADYGKRRDVLISAKIDPVEPPFDFGRIQAADLTGWDDQDGHAGFGSLLGAIESIIGQSPAKLNKEEEQKRAAAEEKAAKERQRQIDEQERREAAERQRLEEERQRTEAEAKVNARQTDRERHDPPLAASAAQKPASPASAPTTKRNKGLAIGAAALVAVLGFIGWMPVSKPQPSKSQKADQPSMTTQRPAVSAAKSTPDLSADQKPPSPSVSKQSSAPAASDQHGKKITNTLGMEFVYIEPGTFTMGSPPDEPKRDDDERQHQVTLTRGYNLQATEVTVGQWRKFVRATGYKSEAETKGDNRTWFDPGFAQDDRSPVTRVSWNDAQAFIEWLSREEGKTYRLPTEAEWEYACRAGTKTPFSFGKCLSTDEANYYGDYPLDVCSKGQYRRKAIAVGSFSANAWGLHDMHGNVWEWCQDWYGHYPAGPVTDPKGPSSGANRVVRGGGWYDDAGNCRSASRGRVDPGSRDGGVGFRLAGTVTLAP